MWPRCAITSSRKIAFLVCLSEACTWSGETAFHELRGGYYDAVALCLMVAAFAARSWPVAAVLLFLGAWTDERALVGAAFLLLFDLCRRGTAGWRSGAAFSALVAYFVVRMASTWILSYQLGPTGGVGLDLFVKQASFMPFAVLSALGGNWVVTGAGMGALIAARRFGLAIGLGVSLIVLVLVSFSVADISRSLAYCLPAVFVALAAVADNRLLTLQLERCALPAGIVAFLLPAIYVEGSSGVYLLESLSMKLWAGM